MFFSLDIHYNILWLLGIALLLALVWVVWYNRRSMKMLKFMKYEERSRRYLLPEDLPAVSIIVFANNDDPTEYTCRLSRDCEIWLGQQVGGLYAIKQITPDAVEISVAIESYYNQNLVEPIYTVLFNRAGEIVRLMHYNAL